MKRVQEVLGLKTYVTTFRSVLLIFVRQSTVNIHQAFITVRKKHTHSIGMTRFVTEDATMGKLRNVFDQSEDIVRNTSIKLTSFAATLETIDGDGIIHFESCLNVSCCYKKYLLRHCDIFTQKKQTTKTTLKIVNGSR